MLANVPLVFQGLFWGALGGAMFHAYWLLSVGHTMNKASMSVAKRNRNFRLKFTVLSGFVGAIAGFFVFVWFFNEIQAGFIAKEKVCVAAALAGLTGEPLLSFLGKVRSLSVFGVAANNKE
ncbi:hypothetical protein VX159_14025 [Dechloromonas sp. ZY10]|uniref:hypothetical protein n=1 Tax=Dechloromonas aquae TaxID=2664436 RepID=UPI0035299731